MQNGQLYTIADNNNVVAEGFFDVDNVQMTWNDGVQDEDLDLPEVQRVHRHIGMVAVSMKRFMDVTATGYEKLDEFEDEQFNNMIPCADCKAMVLDPVVDWISKVDNHVKANFSNEYGINITFFPHERGLDDRGEIVGGGNQSLRDIL
ncbi:expressed unknown protein [Seminavis robusta]|uniref:Uncharacterized protein n=1 Tax=Seminavis robusta TaxID=568900 RepID=A0A9N8F2N1_9STRA|nr:expressed unknown protein [Seminavis robusta]|eukprot:Sro3961_g134381.1  (148) ;mRNA; f:2226-2669